MDVTDMLTRTLPYVQAVLDDDGLRENLSRAGRSGRKATVRPAPKATRLRRAGTAVSEAAAAVATLSGIGEQRRRARRRSATLRVGMLAAAAGAGGVALRQRSSAMKARQEPVHPYQEVVHG